MFPRLQISAAHMTHSRLSVQRVACDQLDRSSGRAGMSTTSRNPLPPEDELKLHFIYELVSGRFFRIGYNRHRGVSFSVQFREVLPNTPAGYALVRYNGVLYRSHRLIWKMVTGIDPGELEIDHIDRDTTNNSWQNLRLASSVEQAVNRRVRRDSTTGVRGVIRTKKSFQAKIQRNGDRVHLGTFPTAAEAGEAYARAASS